MTQATHHADLHLAVEGELTIFTVGEWHRRFSEALTEGASLAVGLDGVEEIDTAGLQLLLMLAADKSVQLRLADASPPVQRIVALAGVGAAFEASREA